MSPEPWVQCLTVWPGGTASTNPAVSSPDCRNVSARRLGGEQAGHGSAPLETLDARVLPPRAPSSTSSCEPEARSQKPDDLQRRGAACPAGSCACARVGAGGRGDCSRPA